MSLVVRRLALALSASLIGSLLGSPRVRRPAGARGAALTRWPARPASVTRTTRETATAATTSSTTTSHDTYGTATECSVAGRTSSLTAREDALVVPPRPGADAGAVTVDGQAAAFRKSRRTSSWSRPPSPIAGGSQRRRASHLPRQARRPRPTPASSRGSTRTARRWPPTSRTWLPGGSPPTTTPATRPPSTSRSACRPGSRSISNGDRSSSRSRAGSLHRVALADAEPMATYLAFFAVGRFQVERASSPGVPGTSRCRRLYPSDRAGRCTAAAAQQPRRWSTGWRQQFGDLPVHIDGRRHDLAVRRLRAGEPEPTDVPVPGQRRRARRSSSARAGPPVVRRRRRRSTAGATSGSTRASPRGSSGATPRPTAAPAPRGR